MLIGEGGYIWKTTDLSDYTQTLTKRTGTLNLLEDGTLEGTVNIEYSGHRAISMRQDGYKDSESKRAEEFESNFKRSMSTAVISDLVIKNFDDNEKPLIYSFKLRVPSYAQKAGSRIFFQPGVFEFGAAPVFSAATRVHPIYFSYPWSEEDRIEINMPDGFALDSADTPGGVADPGNIGSLNINIGIDKENNKLVYTRKFHFGGKGNIFFANTAYTPLKNLFDAFHKADSHTLAMKKNK